MSELKAKLQTQLDWLAASPLVQRWNQLASRERLALSSLGGVALMVGLYGGLWLPVERSRNEAMVFYQQQRELHAYLQARAPEAQARVSQVLVRPVTADLQREVTVAAERQGLAIERLDVQGEDGVQVSLQPAQFAALLAWFEVLQRQGIGIEEAGLERYGDGMVVARLDLRLQQ